MNCQQLGKFESILIRGNLTLTFYLCFHFSLSDFKMSDFFETEAQESDDEENVAADDSSKFI